jgi:hypothetical protein
MFEGKFQWNDPYRIHNNVVWSEQKQYPYEDFEEDPRISKSTEETAQALW